jgi:hypothetical protein
MAAIRISKKMRNKAVEQTVMEHLMTVHGLTKGDAKSQIEAVLSRPTSSIVWVERDR